MTNLLAICSWSGSTGTTLGPPDWSVRTTQRRCQTETSKRDPKTAAWTKGLEVDMEEHVMNWCLLVLCRGAFAYMDTAKLIIICMYLEQWLYLSIPMVNLCDSLNSYLNVLEWIILGTNIIRRGVYQYVYLHIPIMFMGVGKVMYVYVYLYVDRQYQYKHMSYSMFFWWTLALHTIVFWWKWQTSHPILWENLNKST